MLANVRPLYSNLNLSKPFVCCIQGANGFPYSQMIELAKAGHFLLMAVTTLCQAVMTLTLAKTSQE